MRSRWQKGSEWAIEAIIRLSGYLAILILVLLFFFLLKSALPVLKTTSLWEMLGGRKWLPISYPPQFGILPLVVGSLYVTVGAAALAVPVGLGAAIFLSEVASPRLREALKPAIELVAAVPSVVFGFIGLMVVGPAVKAFFNWLAGVAPWPGLLKEAFEMPTGQAAVTASLVLAFMALPLLISIADDAMQAVPKAFKEGSMALGASKWQTIRGVVLPAAKSGIIAAVMLAVGRVIGETMTVLMVAGNARGMPRFLVGFWRPVRTMTATMAGEMGETARNSPHYHALFMVGAVLLVLTFVINLVADYVMNKKRLEEHTS